ncbi:MAG: hypothetical protein K2N55_06610 [Lachnospiraceae bacterium]|nr:hypothetical protein [Lachnospiraceae bacterium]
MRNVDKVFNATMCFFVAAVITLLLFCVISDESEAIMRRCVKLHLKPY